MSSYETSRPSVSISLDNYCLCEQGAGIESLRNRLSAP